MPSTKVVSSPDEAVADIFEGARIMVAGFGSPGVPEALIEALIRKGVGGLTCICGPWYRTEGRVMDASELIASRQVSSLVTAPPVAPGPPSSPGDGADNGSLQIEVMPQGTLAERIRAGGAGIGGFFMATGVGTTFEEGKEKMNIDGVDCIFEGPLKADFALIRAHTADTTGNLSYRMSQRNWNPIMAMAAEVTIAEVDHLVAPGMLDPELVITAGIFVDKILSLGGNTDAS